MHMELNKPIDTVHIYVPTCYVRLSIFEPKRFNSRLFVSAQNKQCGLTVYTEATKLIFKVVLFNKLNIKHKADTNMFIFGSSHVYDVL